MRTTFLAGLALVAVGCASHPAPNDQVASSLASIRGAEEAGALEVPEAALHVKLAQEQVDRAKQLMEDDDNQRAEDLAIRAFQDAELALAMARENAGKKRLEQLSQSSGGEASGAGANTGSSQMPSSPTPATTKQ